MLKKSLLILVALLFSVSVYSQQILTKYVNVPQNEWLRIVQQDINNFTYDKTSYYTINPSFIITKTTELTPNGYLHKVWITSNTQINGLVKNIQIDNPNIFFWDGNQWVNSYYLDWIIIGNSATQVHYFFYNSPNVPIQMQWKTINIRY